MKEKSLRFVSNIFSQIFENFYLFIYPQSFIFPVISIVYSLDSQESLEVRLGLKNFLVPLIKLYSMKFNKNLLIRMDLEIFRTVFISPSWISFYLVEIVYSLERRWRSLLATL